MGYITVSEAAKKWGISDRRVRLLCSQDRIEGVIHKGRKYLIPIDAKKPVDERTRKSKSIPSRNVNVFDEADALKLKLGKKKALPQSTTRRLKNEFLQEFVYNSCAIDGNSLSRREIIQVLDGNVIPNRPLKDHLDAAGARDALEYVFEAVNEKAPLSENTIKQIHSLALIASAREKGHYRTRGLRVRDAYVEPVQPYMLKSRMNDLIFENNRRKKKMHPLERIARFHLEFKGLHPFADANGMTNRLILNFELLQEGYPPADIPCSKRKEYFEAFDAYYRDGDAAPMIDLITAATEEAMRERLKVYEMKQNSKTSLRQSAAVDPVVARAAIYYTDSVLK